MNKFKIGDTIIKVKEGNNKSTIGKTGEIKAINNGIYYFEKTNTCAFSNMSIAYIEDNFELVSISSKNYEIY